MTKRAMNQAGWPLRADFHSATPFHGSVQPITIKNQASFDRPKMLYLPVRAYCNTPLQNLLIREHYPEADDDQ